MQQSSQQSKLDSIFKMLLEMASGNLLYRITLHEDNDELNRISATLNITAERLLNILLYLSHKTFILAKSTQSAGFAKSTSRETLAIIEKKR